MNTTHASFPASPACVRRMAIAALLLIALGASPLRAQLSTWEPMNRGLKHLLVYCIDVDPVDSLVMYCGTEYGNLYKTSDGGFNWVLHNDGIPSTYNTERVTALLLDRNDRTRLHCGFSGRASAQNFFRSTDSAAHWSVIPTPAEWKGGGVLHIFQAGGMQPTLYCGLGWYNGIWASRDSGKTWSKTLDGLGIQVLAGSPFAPKTLYAGSSSTRNKQGPIFSSNDGGVTWLSCGNTNGGWDELTGVRAIAVSPQDTTHVFIGVTGKGEGFYRSVNAGAPDSWVKLLALNDISEIAVHPNNENLIYLSTVRKGVMRTTDGGLHWSSISDGLPAVPIMRVRIAAGYPVRVFAETLDEGIYRLVDEEIPEDFVR